MRDLLEKLPGFSAREKGPSPEATGAVNERRLAVNSGAVAIMAELSYEHSSSMATNTPEQESPVADYNQRNFQYATAAELAKLAEMRAHQALEAIQYD